MQHQEEGRGRDVINARDGGMNLFEGTSTPRRRSSEASTIKTYSTFAPAGEKMTVSGGKTIHPRAFSERNTSVTGVSSRGGYSFLLKSTPPTGTHDSRGGFLFHQNHRLRSLPRGDCSINNSNLWSVYPQIVYSSSVSSGLAAARR